MKLEQVIYCTAIIQWKDRHTVDIPIPKGANNLALHVLPPRHTAGVSPHASAVHLWPWWLSPERSSHRLECGAYSSPRLALHTGIAVQLGDLRCDPTPVALWGISLVKAFCDGSIACNKFLPGPPHCLQYHLNCKCRWPGPPALAFCKPADSTIWMNPQSLPPIQLLKQHVKPNLDLLEPWLKQPRSAALECEEQSPEATLGRKSKEGVQHPIHQNHSAFLELWVYDWQGSLEELWNAFRVFIPLA